MEWKWYNKGARYSNPIRPRGYYIDHDTGLYYLNARYYSPKWRRFISPDDTAYLNPGHVNGLNLYCYCNNDPVNYCDPSGHDWDWGSFWKGLGYLTTGIAAIVAGVLVIVSGVAAIPMLIIAGVTIGAGALTTINGVSEVVEAGTGYNFVEDTVFRGNAAAYNTYATITAGVAAVGSAICGGWRVANNGKIQAVKSGKQFLGQGYKKVGSNRYVSCDGMRQMRLDFGKFGSHGDLSHINLQSYMYTGLKGELLNAHVYFNWWRITHTVITGVLA